MLLVQLPTLPRTTFTPSDHAVRGIKELKLLLESEFGLAVDSLRILTLGGLQLQDWDSLEASDATVDVVQELIVKLRVRGGKGGFGSMLRAQGGRMASKRTTNFESCRDLSGRRLKTINAAKQYFLPPPSMKLILRLAVYMSKEDEREQEKKEKFKRRMEKVLREPTSKKVRFDDTDYLRDSEETLEQVRQAVETVHSVPYCDSTTTTTTTTSTVAIPSTHDTQKTSNSSSGSSSTKERKKYNDLKKW